MVSRMVELADFMGVQFLRELERKFEYTAISARMELFIDINMQLASPD